MKSLMCVLLPLLALKLCAAEQLFDDPIVGQGKGVEVRQSQVEDAFTLLKANRAAAGQPVPPPLEGKMRQQILDKLIATQLVLARATPKDREEGKAFADKYIAETKGKAVSEASFNRQLVASGTTFERYQTEVTEQAIVKAVVDRELKNKEIVTDAEIRKFYDENPEIFEEPEQFRVRHILFATRRIPAGTDLGPAVRKEKLAKAQTALKRLSANEDFKTLVEEYSDDLPSKPKGGELLFSKGGGTVPPEFEAAAASLKVGAVSDIVETVFGYHIIKLEDRTPGKKQSVDKVRDRIKEAILEVRVQKKLHEFIEDLKQKAGVKVTYKADEE